MPSAWTWSQHELVQGHSDKIQSHEVDLIDRLLRRRRPCKKHPDEGKDMNIIVATAVKEVLKTNKNLKTKASSESSSEDEQEHFKFETLKIGEEWQTSCTLRINKAEVTEIGTEAEK